LELQGLSIKKYNQLYAKAQKKANRDLNETLNENKTIMSLQSKQMKEQLEAAKAELELEKNKDHVLDLLMQGTARTREVTAQTLHEVKEVMKLNY
jgi:NADH:ubiquinone oxidoreductase subunit E